MCLWMLVRPTNPALPHHEQRSHAGWIYFAADRRNLVTIGVLKRQPAEHMFKGKRLIFVFPVQNMERAYRDLQRAMGGKKVVDQSAAEAYISHLKGEW